MSLRERIPEHSSAGKIPARCIVGNLVWTHGGTVWGIWRVAPVSYRYLSHSGKLSHHESVRQALIALPPESVVLSVCPPLNLADSAASILKGAEGSPAWYTETAESINDLTAWDPFERWFYVGARLGSGGGWRGEIREQSAGLLRRAFVRPTEHDICSRIAQARKVQKELGASLKLTRPGASEVRWLYARALRRGIRDLGLTPGTATEIHAPGLASIGEIVATEGGDRKDYGRGVLTRYLRVAEPGMDAVGYQCHIALADMPSLYEFPGEEILFGLESFDFPVDWTIKMHRISNAESRRLLAKKSRALMEQLGGKGQLKEIERTGAIPPDLAEAHEALQAHRDRLMALKSEGNVRTTIAMCVWAEDLPTAETRAETVIKAMAPEEWGVQRATGGQAGLLEMGMVGGRSAPVVWNYAQHILPTDIAALAPFAGSDIGDRDGMLLGARMDCQTPRPVLWNPEAPLDAEGSASVGVVGTPGGGKALALDTPIPTPDGWTTMGELKVGDQVFDAEGQPTRVLWVTEAMTGHDCYEVVFSDGERIVADAEHLWFTHASEDRKKGRPPKVATTAEIAGSLLSYGAVHNHAIALAEPLKLPERVLPVDPYTLGVWLGDGHSHMGVVTIATRDSVIVDHIRAAGYPVNEWESQNRDSSAVYLIGSPHHRRDYCKRGHRMVPENTYLWDDPKTGKTQRYCITCRTDKVDPPIRYGEGAQFTDHLRAMDLLHNKHIPDSYLRGSYEQRLALLTGLMDTDGYVDKKGTACEFVSISECLADAVADLIAGLGMKPTRTKDRAQLNGVDCGPRYRIRFRPMIQVFSVPWKASRVSFAETQQDRNRRRYIVDARLVPSVPVRCIAVESSSHLFLAGRSMVPTHNSYFLKRGLHAVLARGGRGVVVDRTPSGEWIRFAAEMQRMGISTSVLTTEPDTFGSFDTFRIFSDPSDQRAYSIGFCLLVTQAATNSLQGICITDAVEEVADLPVAERSLQAVLITLERMYGEGRKGAEEAFLTLRSFARGAFGRMAFDAEIPPADLSADLVVFHIPDLELPDRETMRSENLARQILPEQLGALGVFYLVAAAGREIILADRTRFAVFVGDEAWAWTSSVQGSRLLENTARDGRKRRAAVWIASQHPDDVSDPKLLALLPVRLVFAQGEGAGPAALRFLGAEVSDELVAKLTQAEGGLVRRDSPDAPSEPARCLMRDNWGRIGEIVIRPATGKLAEAFETNPKRIAAYDALPAPEPNGNGEVRPERLGEFPVVSA